MQKKRDFLKKLSNLELWCLLTTYRKSYLLFKKPVIGPVKSKMAEIRHLENWHDVIFFCRGWSDLETGAEWHVDCGDMWSKCKPNSNMADVWMNSMAWHPRATYHIAGCCHLVNSLSQFQSHMSHCRVRNKCHDRATLQGVRIPSAILKIVFAVFYFIFVFNAV